MCQFDELVKRLNIPESEWLTNPEVVSFCKSHHRTNFVPEKLLAALNLDPERFTRTRVSSELVKEYALVI